MSLSKVAGSAVKSVIKATDEVSKVAGTLEKKVLKPTGKVASNILLTENTLEEGGLSALLVHKRLSGIGFVAATGAIMAGNVGKAGLESRNIAKLGPVSYDGGPARMTNNFTSGGLEAMHRLSRNNPQAFSEMATDVMAPDSNWFEKIDNYGVDSQFVSALYGMGGN